MSPLSHKTNGVARGGSSAQPVRAEPETSLHFRPPPSQFPQTTKVISQKKEKKKSTPHLSPPFLIHIGSLHRSQAKYRIPTRAKGRSDLAHIARLLPSCLMPETTASPKSRRTELPVRTWLPVLAAAARHVAQHQRARTVRAPGRQVRHHPQAAFSGQDCLDTMDPEHPNCLQQPQPR